MNYWHLFVALCRRSKTKSQRAILENTVGACVFLTYIHTFHNHLHEDSKGNTVHGHIPENSIKPFTSVLQDACITISPYRSPNAGKSGNGLILDKCKSVPLTFLQWSLQCPGWVLLNATHI